MLDFELDRAAEAACLDAGKCLACGWKPPNGHLARLYVTWRNHFWAGDLGHIQPPPTGETAE
jgi:hypothetical protein